MLRVLAGGAVAAALLLAPAAQADPISVPVPGCYGAESVVVCDPTVTAGVPLGAELYKETVTVCTGTCTDYQITLVRTTSGDPGTLCVTTTSRYGTQTSRCASVPDLGGTIATYRGVAADLVHAIHLAVCYGDTFRCSAALNAAFVLAEDTIRG